MELSPPIMAQQEASRFLLTAPLRQIINFYASDIAQGWLQYVLDTQQLIPQLINENSLYF